MIFDYDSSFLYQRNSIVSFIRLLNNNYAIFGEVNFGESSVSRCF